MRIVCTLVLLSLFLLPAQSQELFTELNAKLTPDGPDYTFRVLGDPGDGSFSAYGIHVIAPGGEEQMLDEFDSLLPAGSEADALYVEDLNFDGYADLRVMEYLPGGANVPYFFWIYDPATAQFKRATAYEVVMSPEVDMVRQELISRQRVSASEYVTEYFKPSGEIPVLVRREERKFQPDGSSLLKIYEVKDDSGPQLVETRQLGPQE